MIAADKIERFFESTLVLAAGGEIPSWVFMVASLPRSCRI
jgi:hypothetical protein